MRMQQSTARRLALRCQGLDGEWNLPQDKEGVAQIIEGLGYVQIDTINVVQRAHHHTLWSRCQDYTPQMLQSLHAEDRRVFEYWAPAAAYVPICDYRYYLPRMRAFTERPRTRQWLLNNAQLTGKVLDRIRTEGPLGSADFKAPPGYKRGTWWSWKPAKEALETLFSMGELMVSARRNFQRIYDLKERVLPPETDTTEPDVDEMGRFIVRRVLTSQGIASANNILRGLGRWRKVISGALQELSDSDEIMPVSVEGVEDETYYVHSQAVKETFNQSQHNLYLHILSPFDNLIIFRRRLEKLFNFEYRLECYIPAEKRRYGYFSLPILRDDRFVGRMDSKADRKRMTFIVRRLVFESGIDGDGELLRALANKIRTFATFNECERIIIERTEPQNLKSALEQEVVSQ